MLMSPKNKSKSREPTIVPGSPRRRSIRSLSKLIKDDVARRKTTITSPDSTLLKLQPATMVLDEYSSPELNSRIAATLNTLPVTPLQIPIQTNTNNDKTSLDKLLVPSRLDSGASHNGNFPSPDYPNTIMITNSDTFITEEDRFILDSPLKRANSKDITLKGFQESPQGKIDEKELNFDFIPERRVRRLIDGKSIVLDIVPTDMAFLDHTDLENAPSQNLFQRKVNEDTQFQSQTIFAALKKSFSKPPLPKKDTSNATLITGVSIVDSVQKRPSGISNDSTNSSEYHDTKRNESIEGKLNSMRRATELISNREPRGRAQTLSEIDELYGALQINIRTTSEKLKEEPKISALHLRERILQQVRNYNKQLDQVRDNDQRLRMLNAQQAGGGRQSSSLAPERRGERSKTQAYGSNNVLLQYFADFGGSPNASGKKRSVINKLLGLDKN